MSSRITRGTSEEFKRPTRKDWVEKERRTHGWGKEHNQLSMGKEKDVKPHEPENSNASKTKPGTIPPNSWNKTPAKANRATLDRHVESYSRSCWGKDAGDAHS